MGAQPDPEAFTLLALGLAFIFIRIGVRWQQVGFVNFQADDYLMPLAGAFFTMETVAAYIVVALFKGLTNSYMTDEQRAALDPNSREYFDRVWGCKIQLIGWVFYATILWLVKACLAVFYSRLTTGLDHLPKRVRIAYIFLGVTYIAVLLSLLLACQPFERWWQIYPHPGNICLPTNSTFRVLIVVIPNIVTDAYLLSIPLPMLWKVNISLKRRVSLMVLFSGAVFIMVAGTIRAVTILTAGPEGAVSGSKWACRETFVAIVVSNIPVIHPLLRRIANKTGLTSLFSSKGRSYHRSGPFESTEMRSGRNKSKGRRGTGGAEIGMGARKSGNHSRLSGRGHGWSRNSDEFILTQDSARTPKDITVTQEMIVQSDPWDQPSSSDPSMKGAALPSRDKWHQERGVDSHRDYHFSADARPTGH